MKKINSLKSMFRQSRNWHADNKTIAFVPTMGALHEGHMSLIRTAKSKADKVIVSIFVNPTQFGPNEDYYNYPRTLSEDIKKCREAGVDVVFSPSVSAMYPGNASTWVNEDVLSQYLCGARRKGHFR
jgi:pantoate--beta-alanine ligase